MKNILNNELKHINYITGIKGLACLMIMNSHLVQVYSKAEYVDCSIKVLDAILESKLSFIIKGDFWVCLFFVVSGFLVSKSEIRSIKDLLYKIISRFIRFAIPILFAYFVTYIIYIVVGFHNMETSFIFANEWFQNFYCDNYSLKTVIFSPISVLLLGAYDFDAPYWVLKDMFLESVLIYILKFLLHKYHSFNKKIVFFVLLTIVSVFIPINTVISSMTVGVIVSIYFDKIIEVDYKYYIFLGVVTIVLHSLLPSRIIYSILFGFLLVIIPRIKFISRLFSSRMFLYLGNISWNIYSFHWPIMCSLGSLLIIKLASMQNFETIYLIYIVFTFVVTIVFSVLYHYGVEKKYTFIIKKLNIFLKKLIY